MFSFNDANVAGSILLILFDAAAKGLVILALAGLAVLALRRSSAAVRHMVWFLAVVSVFALPVLSAVLPGWQVLPHWPTVRAVHEVDGKPQFIRYSPEADE